MNSIVVEQYMLRCIGELPSIIYITILAVEIFVYLGLGEVLLVLILLLSFGF